MLPECAHLPRNRQYKTSLQQTNCTYYSQYVQFVCYKLVTYIYKINFFVCFLVTSLDNVSVKITVFIRKTYLRNYTASHSRRSVSSIFISANRRCHFLSKVLSAITLSHFLHARRLVLMEMLHLDKCHIFLQDWRVTSY